MVPTETTCGGRAAPAAAALDERGTRIAAGLAALVREAPVEVRVSGGSMAPCFADGDRVRLGRIRLLPGDIVAFRTAAGPLLVHRVLGPVPTRRGWRWATRGDTAERADGLLERSRAVGRVVAVRRRGSAGFEPIGVRLADRARALAGLCRYGLGRLVR